jgi:4-amino-4-deoxy-L-arabinose transferase-like glycosyltransferase
MKVSLYSGCFVLVLLLALGLRLFILKDNNFYFTMDQGRDALAVRKILNGKLTLTGPTTAIPGLYAGPLWYYFIGIGYLFSHGHPVGGILPLIIVNVGLIGLLMLFAKKQINKTGSLLLGLGLTVLPPFLVTSWYSFNPHLLPFIVVICLVSLSLLGYKQNYYLLAGATIGLCWHSEIAFLPPLLTLWLAVGIVSVFRKKIKRQVFILGLFIACLFLLPYLMAESINGFSQTKAVLTELRVPASAGIQLNLGERLTSVYKKVMLSSRQSPIFLLICFTYLVFSVYKKRFDVKFKFVFFSLTVYLLTMAWFAFSTRLSPWHLVGLPILLFISLFFSTSMLGKKLSLYGQLILTVFSFYYLMANARTYFIKSNDQSILRNELQAIDWVYQRNNEQGFRVYNFLPSVLDYPYQYLFPWYGQKKYGFLPCEYSTYPNAPKLSYVADWLNYQEKNKTCDEGIFYLIMEPAQEQEQFFKQWHDKITTGSKLLSQGEAGKIKLEKRQKNLDPIN